MSTSDVTRPTLPSLFGAARRVFELSFGEMLWSRRTIFMALVVGGPVLLAVIFRAVESFGMPAMRVNGAPVAGASIFGTYPPNDETRAAYQAWLKSRG